MRRGLGWMLALGVCGLLAGSGAAAEAPNWQTLVEHWLSGAFPESGTRWAAQILQAPAFTGGAVILGCRSQGRQAKRVMTLVARLGPERSARTAELVVQASRRRTVAVAARPVPRGGKLGPGDWRWEERDADTLAADAVREPSELAGKQTRKFLAPNEALTAHALAAIPDVAAGARLTLRVRGEGVTVSTDAQALEDGRIGDTIRLQPLETNRQVKACLLGPQTAEIVILRRQ
jgi:flagella basal body P-ring formation protein FlgA